MLVLNVVQLLSIPNTVSAMSVVGRSRQPRKNPAEKQLACTIFIQARGYVKTLYPLIVSFLPTIRGVLQTANKLAESCFLPQIEFGGFHTPGDF